MNLDKKRTFIVNTLYFGIMLLLAVVLLKYALPLLAPFVIGFVLAYLLKRPIRFASHKLHISRKAAAIALVLVFYCTIGLLLALLEPVLMSIFSGIEQSVLSIDESLIASMEQLWGQFVESLGQLVSSLSAGTISVLYSLAGSLPGLFIKLLLMIISTFFIAMDYDRITGFFIRQMSEKAQEVLGDQDLCHRYAVRLHPFVCAHHVDHICRAVHRPDGRRDRKRGGDCAADCGL